MDWDSVVMELECDLGASVVAPKSSSVLGRTCNGPQVIGSWVLVVLGNSFTWILSFR